MAKPETKRATFGSILDTPSRDIEQPKPLPPGSYIASVQGLPRYDVTTNTGTEFAEFTLNLLEALGDVDEEALDEAGGLKGKTMRLTMWLTDKSAFRFKQFLNHCGAGDDDMTLRERIDETPGKQLVVNLRMGKPNANGTSYLEIASTAPVEE